MNRSSALAAIAVALIVAAAFRPDVVAQRQAAQPTLPEAKWPPRATDIVTVDSRISWSRAGEAVQVYTVPGNAWLVVTDVAIANGPACDLVEVSGSEMSVRCSAQFLTGFHKRLPIGSHRPGVAFEPGSRVAFRSADAQGKLSFHLSGYLTRR